jgi:hypothetical protein
VECENGTASVVFGVAAAGPTPSGVLWGSVVGSASQVPETFTVDMAQANGPTVMSSGALPATGSSGLDNSVSVALVLLAVGASMVVVAQLRRRSGTAA